MGTGRRPVFCTGVFMLNSSKLRRAEAKSSSILGLPYSGIGGDTAAGSSKSDPNIPPPSLVSMDAGGASNADEALLTSA